jgi:hypothetical protein
VERAVSSISVALRCESACLHIITAIVVYEMFFEVTTAPESASGGVRICGLSLYAMFIGHFSLLYL